MKYVERAPLLWKYTEDGTGGQDKNQGLIQVDRGCIGQNRMWNRTTFDHDKLFLCVKIPAAAKAMAGTFMFIDNLVFACAASIFSPESRAAFYKDFVTRPTVIFDHDKSSYSVNIPYNFATTCGFVVN